MWLSKTVMFPTLHAIVRTVLESDEEAKATFFLEPMTDGWVLEDSKKYGIHFYINNDPIVGYAHSAYLYAFTA